MTDPEWGQTAAAILVPVVLAAAGLLTRLIRDVARLQGEVQELSNLLRTHITHPFTTKKAHPPF